MRKPRKVMIPLAALAFAVAASSAWLVSCHRAQLTFADEPLSTWVSRFWAQGDPREREDAAAAIRAMGDAAGGKLVDWMRYEPAPAKEKLEEVIERVPIPFLRRIHFAASSAETRADMAMGVFDVLGPAVTNAIPRLLVLLTDRRAPQSARRAMRVFRQIGEPALAPLLRVLADNRAPNRDMAAFAIAGMQLDRRDADQALPLLLRSATDPDPSLAEVALFALGELDVDPDGAVPALLKRLQDPSPELRSRAASSLAKYASTGHREAIAHTLPILLSDPDQDTREAATNLLAKIAPGVLTNTAAK